MIYSRTKDSTLKQIEYYLDINLVFKLKDHFQNKYLTFSNDQNLLNDYDFKIFVNQTLRPLHDLNLIRT